MSTHPTDPTDPNTSTDLHGTTAVVTGASRGFGRAIVLALTGAGAQVVGLARNAGPLDEVRELAGERFVPVVGDAADPDLARDLTARYRPRAVVLNAGAVPTMASLREHTWESFSRPWEVDTQAAFHWTRAALRLPLTPGSTVVAVSSGAALRGSPLSGGYSGAKATMRFIAAYAAAESQEAGLGIRFRTLLPQLTPLSGVGATGAAGYAEQEGVGTETYLERFRPWLTTELVGATVLDLIRSPGGAAGAETLLTGSGARPVPQPA